MNESLRPEPRSRPLPLRFVARVCVQLATPIHVGTGRDWHHADAGIVCDANGLPTIPGSALGGVLREAYRRQSGSAVRERSLRVRSHDSGASARGSAQVLRTDDLFGIAGSREHHGAGSRLRISWARIHDARNVPVDSLRSRAQLEADPVLRAALRAVVRDHVRIGARGVAEKRGKFDERVAQAGHRFSFEIELAGEEADRQEFEKLLGLLRGGELRIGGKTRRGLGAFRVISARSRSFDLSRAEEFEAYVRHDVSLESAVDWPEEPGESFAGAGLEAIRLELTPESFWMIGGGYDDRTGADSAPVLEDIVVWGGDAGRVEMVYVLPGSSVKGALRHRTHFHLYAACGYFGDDAAPDATARQRADRELELLFGSVANAGGPQTEGGGSSECGAAAESVGRAGRIWIDDAFLEPQLEADGAGAWDARLQHHVCIDRFTGGVSEGLLFNDLPLAPGSAVAFEAEGSSAVPRARSFPAIRLVLESASLTRVMRECLHRALDDLCGGRLPLGAHAGRGYGFFGGSHDLARETASSSPETADGTS